MRLLAPVLAVLFALGLALAAPALAGSQQDDYVVPSSVVVRGTFGFGVLACADDRLPATLQDSVQNGPCFDYSGAEGNAFLVSADDVQWRDTSVTVAVDLNGDGCVSDSCQGVPNDADYRVSNCGAVAGILPTPEAGVQPVLQVYLRALDITENHGYCGASTGTVYFQNNPL